MVLKKKIIIYTAIMGDKDELIEPSFVSLDCDYVCFSDINRESNIWQVIKKDFDPIGDKVRSARKYKILTHKYFPDYDYSIWVDGNLEIKHDLVELIDQYLSDANFATFDHANYKSNPAHNKLQALVNYFKRDYKFVRHCVYEEAEALIEMNKQGVYKDDEQKIRKQMARYRTEAYPENNSILQSAILVRRHNESDVVRTAEDWWTEIVNGSRRDQLSFNYVAWKNNFKFNYIVGDPRKNKYVRKLAHKIK